MVACQGMINTMLVNEMKNHLMAVDDDSDDYEEATAQIMMSPLEIIYQDESDDD